MKYCPTCGKVVPRGHGFKSDQKILQLRLLQIENAKND